MTDQGRCVRCGGGLVPVLVAEPGADDHGPILADPPVRITCPACDPPPTPQHGTRL